MKFFEALDHFGAKHREMAELLGVSPSTITGWKRAGTVPPMVTLLVISQREAREEIAELRRENAELRAAVKVLKQC